jgi:hypothetical protein
MTIVITRIQAITTTDTAQVRQALKAAGVRGATIRKGSGAMRYMLTVTTLPGQAETIIAALRPLGFVHEATDKWRLDGRHQVRFEKPAPLTKKED